ncbi:MAG TPA: diacylglycerol kinase family protein [Candidatus Polarisedimenticolaceae bacterium]|nr:diacylglycerol kinase family protein [Candidatus Polarisedimenticolaceae bacterium]
MGQLKLFIRSIYTAFTGLVFVVRIERNARLHLIFALIALGLCIVLGVSNTELAAIFFAIILVFTSEIINTALEKTLDLIEPNHHAQVRIIKDIAAGAVLVTSIGAVAIGAAIFLPYIGNIFWPGQ